MQSIHDIDKLARWSAVHGACILQHAQNELGVEALGHDINGRRVTDHLLENQWGVDWDTTKAVRDSESGDPKAICFNLGYSITQNAEGNWAVYNRGKQEEPLFSAPSRMEEKDWESIQVDYQESIRWLDMQREEFINVAALSGQAFEQVAVLAGYDAPEKKQSSHGR